MAGIGEASAILAVAQVGISLSNTLIAYIADVKDAPNRIQRVGNEILTTSERLKEIGELIEKNKNTQIFSAEGINSAVRCSAECEKIIVDVKTVIQKSKPKDLEKDEIDTSLFSTLRWPFVKIKLEVPRAELQRIKIDLTLLFTSAMALGASTAAEKLKFRSDIPGLQRTRDWAAQRAEQAKERAQEPNSKRPSRKRREAQLMDNEPELLQKFVEFEERRAREVEDQKAKDRIVLIRLEEDNKKIAEKQARDEIEKNAIEKYKKDQEEHQTRHHEKKKIFGKELERLGFSPEQIESIFESPNLGLSEANDSFNFPIVKPGPITHESSNSSAAAGIQANEIFPTSRKPSSIIPWRRSKKINTNIRGEHHQPALDPQAEHLHPPMEVWLIDLLLGQTMEVPTSDNWLVAKSKKRQDVSHQFAMLKPLWRTAVNNLLKFRNDGEDQLRPWILYYLEIPRKRQWRVGLLGQKPEGQILRVILYQHGQSNQENGDSNRKDGFHASTNLASRAPVTGLSTNQVTSDPDANIQYLNPRKRSRNTLLKDPNPSSELDYSQQTPRHVLFADDNSKVEPGETGRQTGIKSPLVPQSHPLNAISLTEKNIGRVVVHVDAGHPSSGPVKGITYIPTDLVSSDAVVELEYSHYIHSGVSSKDNGELSVLVIEKPLTVSEVRALMKLTREKMNKGELPWKPERILEFLEVPSDHGSPVDDEYHNMSLKGDYNKRADFDSKRTQRASPVEAEILLSDDSNSYLQNLTGETHFPRHDLHRSRDRERERYRMPAPRRSSHIGERQRGISPYYYDTIGMGRPGEREIIIERRDSDQRRRGERREMRISEPGMAAYGNDKGEHAKDWEGVIVRPYSHDPGERQEAEKSIKMRQPSFERRRPAIQRDERERARPSLMFNQSETEMPIRHVAQSPYPNRSQIIHRDQIERWKDSEMERRKAYEMERAQMHKSLSSSEIVRGTKQYISQPSRRRSKFTDTQHDDESSEEDDDYLRSTADKQRDEKQGHKPEFSDAELIIKTLKRFTTFTDDNPSVTTATTAVTMIDAEDATSQGPSAKMEAKKSSESLSVIDLSAEPVTTMVDHKNVFVISPTSSQSGDLDSITSGAEPVVETSSEKGWESVSEHQSIKAVSRKATAEDFP